MDAAAGRSRDQRPERMASGVCCHGRATGTAAGGGRCGDCGSPAAIFAPRRRPRVCVATWEDVAADKDGRRGTLLRWPQDGQGDQSSVRTAAGLCRHR